MISYRMFLASVLPLFFMLGIGCRGGVCAGKKNLGQGVFFVIICEGAGGCDEKICLADSFSCCKGKKNLSACRRVYNIVAFFQMMHLRLKSDRLY